MSNHAKGLMITVAGVLILTPDTMLIRLIGGDPWALIFWRGVGVFAITFAVFLLRVGPRQLAKDLWATGFHGLGGMTCYFTSGISFVLAMQYTTAANLLVILASSPIWAMVYSRIWLKEKSNWPTVLTIIVCLVGVVIVFSDGLLSAERGLGEFFALLSALSIAANFTIIRGQERKLARGQNLGNMLLVNGVGALLTALAVYPMSADLNYSANSLIYLLLLCGLLLPISFMLIGTGPKYIPAAEVSLIMILETALGPVWVWLAVDEAPSWRGLLGGMIIITALLVHGLWQLRLETKPKLAV